MLAARAHKNLLDLRSMGGSRSMRAVEDPSAHPPSKRGGERERERSGRTPALLPCSRNAHPQNGLVRRAQLEQHGCPTAMKLYKRREEERGERPGCISAKEKGPRNPVRATWRGLSSVGSSDLFGFFGLSGSENQINEINQLARL